MRELTLTALPGIPEVAAGMDLATVMLEAVTRSGQRLLDGDVLVVAQKIVSKSEGRSVRLADVVPSARAQELAQRAQRDPRLVELILRESREVLRVKPGVLIVEHRLGFVMASAGIDQSNVPAEDESALLLPVDPDASARRIREDLARRTSADVGIVVNDSFGRAWRNGVTGVAIGVAGIPALVDLRGSPDRGGRALKITQVAAADEIASAASLLMGQAAEGLPVVLVRGFPYGRSAGTAAELVRERAQDLFRVIVALAGGVGGGRMAAGLAAVLPPRDLAVVVNTADDFDHLGLHISPDLDSVMYALAGLDNRETGWGRAGETWRFMETLHELGGETWFRLGDRDLAVHVLRTRLLARGLPLSAVTRLIAERLAVRHAIVPMSETPVRTRVRCGRRVLDFQEYFVKLRCRPRVSGFRFWGSRAARVPRALQRLLRPGRVRAAVICPSNPYVSVAPILSVPAIGAWLAARSFPVVGVSPIVGGAAVKGPAAKMMRELNAQPSALGIVRHYGGKVDGWVIDRKDAGLARAIAGEGKAVLVTDTIMSNPGKSAALAQRVVAFALSLATKRD